MNKETTKQKSNDITTYYAYNRFSYLFFHTKKYKELIFTKEAVVCFILSLITIYLFVLILKQSNHLFFPWIQFFNLIDTNTVEILISTIRSILTITITGLFCVLGFLIGGLAILTGTLGNKVIRHINNDGTIKNLISIMFNFYFAGAITGLSIVLSIISYLITFTAIPFNLIFFYILTFFTIYLTYFSIIYSIMLLGTCIRLFLLAYKFYEEDESKNSNKK